jgi:hypothetical protein
MVDYISKIEIVPIYRVKPNPDNPRVIRDERYDLLLKSLKDFPDMAAVRPLIVNEDNIVLGGNMRLRAMKDAGWTEIPVIRTNWSENKQREFIIKDNIAFGEWDWNALANEWDTDELVDWGMVIPGFDEPSIDDQFASESEEDNQFALVIKFESDSDAERSARLIAAVLLNSGIRSEISKK